MTKLHVVLELQLQVIDSSVQLREVDLALTDMDRGLVDVWLPREA